MSARLRAVYERVTSWQRRTFPQQTAAGLLAHMRKELAEIEAAPLDVEERADMAILAMGVFDRLGMEPHIGFVDAFGTWAWGKCGTGTATHILSVFIADRDPRFLALRHILVGCTFGIPSIDTEDKCHDAIEAKMAKNEDRRWPAPADQVPGQPVEHIRDEELHVDAVIAALTPAPDVITSEVELLRARVAELEAQRAEWRADNERLREERNKIRTWLQAVPNEGAVEAVHRLIREVNALRNREVES